MFIFPNLIFDRFRIESAKKSIAFAIFNRSKMLQNIFKMGLKKCAVIAQKLLSKKKYSEINNLQPGFLFCLLLVKSN